MSADCHANQKQTALDQLQHVHHALQILKSVKLDTEWIDLQAVAESEAADQIAFRSFSHDLVDLDHHCKHSE